MSTLIYASVLHMALSNRTIDGALADNHQICTTVREALNFGFEEVEGANASLSDFSPAIFSERFDGIFEGLVNKIQFNWTSEHYSFAKVWVPEHGSVPDSTITVTNLSPQSEDYYPVIKLDWMFLKDRFVTPGWYDEVKFTSGALVMAVLIATQIGMDDGTIIEAEWGVDA